MRHRPRENIFAGRGGEGFTYIFNKHFVFLKDLHLISKMNLRKWAQEKVKSSLHCLIEDAEQRQYEIQKW